jgi:hypothetical protein
MLVTINAAVFADLRSSVDGRAANFSRGIPLLGVGSIPVRFANEVLQSDDEHEAP